MSAELKPDAPSVATAYLLVAQLERELALAKACYEYQRRMAVQQFDESHLDDLLALIHATVQQHERISGRYIYLASYLEKAIFELLKK